MHLNHIENFSRVGIYQLQFLETDYKDGEIVNGGAVTKTMRVTGGQCTVSVSWSAKDIISDYLPRNTKRAALSVCQEQLKLKADQMEKDKIKWLKRIDLADLTLKLSEYHIPSEFSQCSYKCKGEINCEEVLCFQQNVFDMGRPCIQYCLVVHQSLRFECFINKHPNKHFKHLYRSILNTKKKQQLGKSTRLLIFLPLC